MSRVTLPSDHDPAVGQPSDSDLLRRLRWSLEAARCTARHTVLIDTGDLAGLLTMADFDRHLHTVRGGPR